MSGSLNGEERSSLLWGGWRLPQHYWHYKECLCILVFYWLFLLRQLEEENGMSTKRNQSSFQQCSSSFKFNFNTVGPELLHQWPIKSPFCCNNLGTGLKSGGFWVRAPRQIKHGRCSSSRLQNIFIAQIPLRPSLLWGVCSQWCTFGRETDQTKQHFPLLIY